MPESLRPVRPVFVYSRAAIERVPPLAEPHVVVSITSSPDDVARLPPSSARRAVLRLAFADVDVATEGLVLFERAHAEAIAALLAAHPALALVVHCDAGLSRSPAVAAAVTRAEGGDDAPWYRRYRPNAHVYRLLLETLTSFSPPPLDRL